MWKEIGKEVYSVLALTMMKISAAQANEVCKDLEKKQRQSLKPVKLIYVGVASMLSANSFGRDADCIYIAKS